MVVSGAQGWLWPQLQVRCAVRRGWRRREKQSRRRLELVARNGIPGLGSQACASSCTVRGGRGFGASLGQKAAGRREGDGERVSLRRGAGRLAGQRGLQSGNQQAGAPHPHLAVIGWALAAQAGEGGWLCRREGR